MKTDHIAIFYAIAGITIALLAFGPKDTLVPTGKDVSVSSFINHNYIIGEIDGAMITDTNQTFVCDSPDTNADMMAEKVASYIRNHSELQAQPKAFAVLNAYHQLYCR